MNDKKEYIKKAIDQLEEFGFLKALDRIGEYSKNSILFFKQIDEQRFILFHYYNRQHAIEHQGFNCWISTYDWPEFIGKVPAIEKESVKESFDFKEDWKLIAEFLF